MKQDAGGQDRNRQVAETPRDRRTTQAACMKTGHQTFRRSKTQTDRQQKVVNVDREADAQEDR